EDSAAALWPFTIRPIAVFGNAPLGDTPQFAGEDISAIQSVGEVFGEVDIEKMAALDPDLIVTPIWPQQEATSGGIVAEFERRVAPIAPVVAVDAYKPFRRMIDRYQELAAALGVDLGAPAVAEARTRLDAAFAALEAAAKDTRDLRVLALSAGTDQLYVANPSQYSDLQEYQAAGLEFVVPTDTSGFGGIWEALSFEQANKYHADLILYDNRPPGSVLTTLQGVPTWGTLPAVKEGQIAPWYVGTTYRLSFFAQHVEELAGLIQRSRRLG
ncbi:MAG: ABC transporter substrate-binding protein, partial [Dehalococcoidia bacterium]